MSFCSRGNRNELRVLGSHLREHYSNSIYYEQPYSLSKSPPPTGFQTKTHTSHQLRYSKDHPKKNEEDSSEAPSLKLPLKMGLCLILISLFNPIDQSIFRLICLKAISFYRKLSFLFHCGNLYSGADRYCITVDDSWWWLLFSFLIILKLRFHSSTL